MEKVIMANMQGLGGCTADLQMRRQRLELSDHSTEFSRSRVSSTLRHTSHAVGDLQIGRGRLSCVQSNGPCRNRCCTLLPLGFSGSGSLPYKWIEETNRIPWRASCGNQIRSLQVLPSFQSSKNHNFHSASLWTPQPHCSTISQIRARPAPASTALGSGRHACLHSLNVYRQKTLLPKGAFQLGIHLRHIGTLLHKRNTIAERLRIRGAQYENVVPVPIDNGLASLESLLEVSPVQPELRPPQTAEEKSNQRYEELIERAIFDCRFLTLMAVVGSLAGAVLCFFKGSLSVVGAFAEYFQASWQGLGTSQVIFLLVEAVDVYLLGTVMLIFGMGLYELFVSTLEVAGEVGGVKHTNVCGSNLFGLFRLTERPKWLEIHSLDELKTKLGHVIVMILLVGMFEKSKKVPINSGIDLLYFSASILLSSGCLYLLSKLHHDKLHE